VPLLPFFAGRSAGEAVMPRAPFFGFVGPTTHVVQKKSLAQTKISGPE
jgi:hypothetical protein